MTAVLSWHVQNFCCDLIAKNWITSNWIYYLIRITSIKLLVKWSRCCFAKVWTWAPTIHTITCPHWTLLGLGMHTLWPIKCAHNFPFIYFIQVLLAVLSAFIWEVTKLAIFRRDHTPDPNNLKEYIDGLMQERRNSSALAMELRLSCTNPWIWTCVYVVIYWTNYISETLGDPINN